MTAPTAPNRHSNYITRGILRGKKVAYSRSTLAIYAVTTVHQVDKLVKSGLKDQSLINKLFEKQLEKERLMKLFIFRK